MKTKGQLSPVSPDPIPGEDDAEQSQTVADGRAGQRSLGSRNRWAVICLDGNDIGAQHRRAGAVLGDGDNYRKWLAAMSKALQQANHTAMVAALEAVLVAWAADSDNVTAATRTDRTPDGKQDTVVLPLRPLILGGDDATVICHCRHAIAFVRTFCKTFESESVRLAAEHARTQTMALWPATSNRLTTSAGVLFVNSSYPLHSAALITENLLAMAKHRGRASAVLDAPAPSAIDWETLTESFADHPAARRKRELQFVDDDIKREVRLTARPYLLSDLQETASGPLALALHTLRQASVPRTLSAQLFDTLRKPSLERRCDLYSLKKRHPHIQEALDDDPDPAHCGRGWTMTTGDGAPDIQATSYLDAISLLDEEHRLEQETAP